MFKKQNAACVISILLVVAMIFGLSVGSFASSGTVSHKSGEYELSKLSHPTKGSGEVDGNEVVADNSFAAIMDRVFGDVIRYFVTFFKEFHLILDVIF